MQPENPLPDHSPELKDPLLIREVDENGWPIGYFDRVPGSMPELKRWPQGEFEERLTLE